MADEQVTWVKDPDSELDFGIDWAPTIDGDTINTSEWLGPVPAGLVVGTGPKAPSKTATTTTVWLSAGTPGVEYAMTNRVVTLGGRTYDQDVTLRVLSIPAVLPGFGGCVWPIDPACLSDDWDKYDDVTRLRAVSLASASLTRLTGGRVGDCPVRLRPAPQNGCIGFAGPLPALGFSGLDASGVVSVWGGTGRVRNPREIVLPAPVYKVVQVTVDGLVVPATDYEVHNRELLVYTGDVYTGWPAAQDFGLASTEVGTFEVTYLNTAPVDSAGAYAAGLLAVEFAKACSGTSGCKLPGNITTIVRAGVSFEVISGAFPDGLTGLRAVDIYTAQWNRNARGPASLFDPGAPDHRVVTG